MPSASNCRLAQTALGTAHTPQINSHFRKVGTNRSIVDGNLAATRGLYVVGAARVLVVSRVGCVAEARGLATPTRGRVTWRPRVASSYSQSLTTIAGAADALTWPI